MSNKATHATPTNISTPMTYEALLEAIDSLCNFYVCTGVEIEIEALRAEGKSYEEIWEHFQILDEMED